MNLKVASSYLLGAIFLVAGIAHFVKLDFFMLFLPHNFPAKELTIQATGVLHVLLGIGIWMPRTRSLCSLLAGILLLLYIPLHIIDLNRYMPVVGSKAMAWLRLPAQVLLILMAYLASRWEKN